MPLFYFTIFLHLVFAAIFTDHDTTPHHFFDIASSFMPILSVFIIYFSHYYADERCALRHYCYYAIITLPLFILRYIIIMSDMFMMLIILL